MKERYREDPALRDTRSIVSDLQLACDGPRMSVGRPSYASKTGLKSANWVMVSLMEDINRGCGGIGLGKGECVRLSAEIARVAYLCNTASFPSAHTINQHGHKVTRRSVILSSPGGATTQSIIYHYISSPNAAFT